MVRCARYKIVRFCRVLMSAKTAEADTWPQYTVFLATMIVPVHSTITCKEPLRLFLARYLALSISVHWHRPFTRSIDFQRLGAARFLHLERRSDVIVAFCILWRWPPETHMPALLPMLSTTFPTKVSVNLILGSCGTYSIPRIRPNRWGQRAKPVSHLTNALDLITTAGRSGVSCRRSILQHIRFAAG
jgi:hypothetical protein